MWRTHAWGDVLKVFKDKNVVVFKNNLVSKGLDALKPGDVITVVPCEGDSDVDYAILVLGIKNGVFTKLKDHTVTIGGQSYQADEEMRYTFNRKTYEIFDGSTEAAEELRGQLNATVTYYVGRNGKVACLQFGGNQAGSTIYGILTGFTVSDSKMGADAGSVTELEVYTSTGRTVTYEVEPEVYFSEESGMAEHDWQIIDHYATPQTSLMRFEVNSAGKVEKALEVELSGIGTQWEADKDYATFDGKELTDDFVAFHIKLGSSDHAIKSVSKISKTTLLRSSKASAQYGAYVEDKDGIPVLFFIEFGGVNYYQYGIISDVGFADSTVDYGVLLTTKSSTKKYDARNKGDLQALNLDSGDLVSYRIVSSEIDVEEKLIDVSQDFPAGLSSSVQQYSAVVESIASDRLRVKAGDSGLDYDYDSSTIILDYTNFDDPKVMKSADFLELDKEEYVVALFPDLVNRQYDELLAIVVLERQEGVDYDFNGFE